MINDFKNFENQCIIFKILNFTILINILLKKILVHNNFNLNLFYFLNKGKKNCIKEIERINNYYNLFKKTGLILFNILIFKFISIFFKIKKMQCFYL